MTPSIQTVPVRCTAGYGFDLLIEKRRPSLEGGSHEERQKGVGDIVKIERIVHPASLQQLRHSHVLRVVADVLPTMQSRITCSFILEILTKLPLGITGEVIDQLSVQYPNPRTTSTPFMLGPSQFNFSRICK